MQILYELVTVSGEQRTKNVTGKPGRRSQALIRVVRRPACSIGVDMLPPATSNWSQADISENRYLQKESFVTVHIPVNGNHPFAGRFILLCYHCALLLMPSGKGDFVMQILGHSKVFTDAHLTVRGLAIV